MPSGKRNRSRAVKAPLSSLTVAPVTAETQDRLAAVGLSAFCGTESEAVAMLALHSDDDNLEEYAPVCFRLEYDPERVLCTGCVFSGHCWPQDNTYLAALRDGKAPNPPGISDSALAKFLPKKMTRKAPPPKVGKRGV